MHKVPKHSYHPLFIHLQYATECRKAWKQGNILAAYFLVYVGVKNTQPSEAGQSNGQKTGIYIYIYIVCLWLP